MERTPEQNKKINNNYKRRHPRRHMLNRSRKRAKAKGWDFNLDVDDLDQPTHCPVLGIELDYNRSSHGPDSPSLDRIDSTKGYVKGNVIVVSWRCNSLKKDATNKELQQIADFYCED